MEKEFYTVEEFAKALVMSTQSIRKLIREGRIHAIRMADSNKSPYRIHKTQIERLMKMSFQEQNKDINNG